MSIDRKETWDRTHVCVETDCDPFKVCPLLSSAGMDVESVLTHEHFVFGNIPPGTEQSFAGLAGVKSIEVDKYQEGVIALAKSKIIAPGTRVRVLDGSGNVHIGDGVYEGDVTVYVMRMPDGSLQSLSIAELRPDPATVPAGAVVSEIKQNPKIRLDDGRVVYGCQVWYATVEQFEREEAKQKEQEEARKGVVKSVAGLAAGAALGALGPRK